MGEAVHDEGDQFLRIEAAHGVVTIDARETEINDGDGIVIPAGARHNIKNTGEKPLKLFSLYAPPRYRRATSPPRARTPSLCPSNLTAQPRNRVSRIASSELAGVE